MNCKCGERLRIVETRCDGINTYRLRWCPKCFTEIATQESVVDLTFGKRKLYETQRELRHRKKENKQ